MRRTQINCFIGTPTERCLGGMVAIKLKGYLLGYEGPVTTLGIVRHL